jgi:hypothetical protein
MLKASAGRFSAANFNAAKIADAAVAASRQVWLAGLGAATISRHWATNDAAPMFRSLVREGEVAEGRARRTIDRQLGNSLALAAMAWNKTRKTALTTASGIVDVAAAALPRYAAKPAKASRRAPVKARKARGGKRTRKS